MSKFVDLTGQRFTRLLVIKRAGYTNDGSLQWFCLCNCGDYRTVRGGNLQSGHTKSCGCLCKELLQTHGMSNTPEYKARQQAIQRCDNPNNPDYEDYGGRGIKFCQRWRGSNGFINFLKDMGSRPGPGYTLERIDNDGNYEPGNCVWGTRKEQQNNTRKNKWFKATSIIGREYTSKNRQEFSRQFNLNSTSIWGCLNGRQKRYKGWTFEYI